MKSYDGTPEEALKAIDEYLHGHEEIQRSFYASTIVERLKHIVSHYKDVASNSLLSCQHFRDDVVIGLKAIALVVDMAANAGTHGEKNARLRGVNDLIGSAIEKLRQQEYNFAYTYYRWDDIFSCDTPVRNFLNRIHDLEAENRSLRETLAKLPQDANATSTEGQIDGSEPSVKTNDD